VNLVSDAPVPGISASQFLAVEPNLDARCPERFSDALRGWRIL
jgi:hypothetical protein